MNTTLISEFKQIYNLLQNNIRILAGRDILITGATGLIGSYLVSFLIWVNAQYDMGIGLWLVSRSRKKLVERFGNKHNLHFIECDISIPNTLKTNQKFDFIIHGASPTDPAIYADNPIGVMTTNIIGTMQILNVATQSNAQTLFISSGEVYGPSTGAPMTESAPAIINTWTARSCYPAAKAACEAMCQSAAQMHNLHINVVRPCFVYGPQGQTQTSRVNAQFIAMATSGQNIILNSAGNQVRSWCYVADTVSAILWVLTSAPAGQAYNIANPESVVSIYEWAQILANQVHVDVEFATDATQKWAINSDSVLDAGKLVASGWRPIFDLQTGLQHSISIKSLTCVYDE